MEIADWRNKIDELDEQIVHLLGAGCGGGADRAAEGAEQLRRSMSRSASEAVFAHVQQYQPRAAYRGCRFRMCTSGLWM